MYLFLQGQYKQFSSIDDCIWGKWIESECEKDCDVETTRGVRRYIRRPAINGKCDATKNSANEDKEKHKCSKVDNKDECTQKCYELPPCRSKSNYV